MSSLAEDFNNSMPDEATPYVKALLRFVVVTYAEDKHTAYDYLEFMLNKISTEDERNQLDDQLVKAMSRMRKA